MIKKKGLYISQDYETLKNELEIKIWYTLTNLDDSGKQDFAMNRL